MNEENMPPLTPEQRALLALHLVPGIGPKLLAALIERLGSAAAALQTSVDELQAIPHLGPLVAARLQQALANGDVEAEIDLMQRHKVHVLFHGTPEYPLALAEIAAPPPVLYVRGKIDPADRQAIAIVGSRSCTSYGRRVAERLGLDLARAGWTIVSGLARGIDGCAHKGALEAKGRTVAVLAGGLSKVYPPEHADLAEEVVQAGALLSESGMRMEPMAGMFPARNRIISGLCRAVVIVEAAEQSGALITARHAAEQGRDVFAVPGPVDSIASTGTLKLLREGAKLVRHAGDILEDLQGLAPNAAPVAEPPRAQPAGLDEVQQQIWDVLTEPRNIDDLARHMRQSSAGMAGLLMNLELKKVIRRLPGNVYERV